MSSEARPLPGDSIQIAREYMDSLLVEGRIIGSVYPSSEMILFGEKFATPIMTGALSHLKYGDENGMPLMAKGAHEAGAAVSIGMGGIEELDAVLATGARTMKIIKPYADRSEVFRRIEFAEAHGAMAVGMDVEHSVNIRNAENCVCLDQQLKLPTMDELKEYVQATKLPFVIKGVMSVQDALRCAELGCKGVVLSHHNGHLRYAVPPVRLLPEIRKAVGDSMTIFIDGGIESGYDAFKALALGADAVCVGRVLMPPLAKRGADGVRDTILELTDELKAMMIRTDSPDIRSIDPTVIRQK